MMFKIIHELVDIPADDHLTVTRKTGNNLLTGKRRKLPENTGKHRKTPKIYQNLGRRSGGALLVCKYGLYGSYE